MEMFLLVTLILAGWFWFDSVTVREVAITTGRDLADRCGLQLLDETVACGKLRLGRNSRGHLQLLRTYDFEVSASGAERLQCTLVLLGKQLQSWHIPPYLQPLH
ncbi:MAG TPA: DUF3301 domain-containing protein [Methylophilaceae bacterium]